MQPAPIEHSVQATPGPWHIEPAPSPSSMKSIRTADGKAIAFVNRGPNAEANARLIAAAAAYHEAAMEYLMTHAAFQSEAGEGMCVCDVCLVFRPIAEQVEA